MSLRYPENINGSRDFIKFTIGEYSAPVAGGGYIGFDKLPALRGEEIFLNMPSEIGSSFTGAWQGKNTTGLAQAALNIVKGVGDAGKKADKFQQELQQKVINDSNLKNLLGAGVEDAIRFLGDTLGQAPGLGGNLLASDFLQIGTGTIINPNTELFYGGQTLRSHAYNFKLIPQSKSEAAQILQIVERFKKACLPKRATALFGGNFKNFIKVPDVCQVQFCDAGGGENKNLPKYGISAFTAVSTSYITDNQYMSLRDGEPIGISLSISLTELKLVFNEDIGEIAR